MTDLVVNVMWVHVKTHGHGHHVVKFHISLR